MGVRCERCGRFGAREVWVSGDPLPRTPAENWVCKFAGNYGEYGKIVEVGRVAGHEVFTVHLCRSCRERERLVVSGRVSRCDRCGARRYGAGGDLSHLCEDCLLAEVARFF